MENSDMNKVQFEIKPLKREIADSDIIFMY
jgi:hypothetical protein